MIILGSGGQIISAERLCEEIKETKETIQKEYLEKTPQTKNLLFNYASPDLAKWLEDIRLNKQMSLNIKKCEKKDRRLK